MRGYSCVEEQGVIHDLVSLQLLNIDSVALEHLVRATPRKYIDWYFVSSECGNLSESFVQTYRDCLDWNCVSAYSLSEDFLRKNKEYIVWEFLLSRREHLSNVFQKEFCTELTQAMVFREKKLE